MKKRLKYITLITVLSFTFVILLNCIILLMGFGSTILEPIDIIVVFIVNLLIGIFISIGDLIPIARDYQVAYNYFICIFLAVGVNRLIHQDFYWTSFFIELIMVTLVFIAVYMSIYFLHYKEAQYINNQIKEKHNRNFK